jgi:AcrR family transcriptional regulator
MGRPKVHDEALRTKLLDAAAAIAFDDGMEALSLRRVAAAADTSTTAVYSLFGNKAGLVESLYREAMRRFAARLATVEPSADPATDMLRLGLAYRDYALHDPHLYSIMFAGRAKRPVSKVPKVPKEAGSTIAPLVDAVRRGQEAGQLTAGPPERIALACWGVAHGLVSLELTGNVPPPLDIAAGYEDALRAVVRGWRA